MKKIKCWICLLTYTVWRNLTVFLVFKKEQARPCGTALCITPIFSSMDTHSILKTEVIKVSL